MTTIVAERPQTTFRPGYRGFLAFCTAIDFELEPYMRRIARAFFGDAREIAIVIARGNFKTTIGALLGLHHLVSVPGARVVIGAMSKDQARVCYERMRGFAEHPALADEVIVRHLELRYEDRWLRVVPADGGRLRGQSPTLMLGDEVWGWPDRVQLLESMQEALVKEPESKLFLISTSTADLSSPLGRLRRRALALPDVRRRGVVTEAKGPDLHWVEWSCTPEEANDLGKVAQANPAKYIRRADLRRQRESVAEAAFLQFHACVWGRTTASWLPPGLWGELADPDLSIEPGEAVFCGVDVGGSRSSTALAVVTEDLRAKVEIWEGDRAVLEVADRLREVASTYTVRSVAFDPWRFRSEALRLEDAGLPMEEFPQSSVRMCPASERLFAAITERRLRHDGEPELAKHIANCIARETPRGFRLDRANDTDRIDAAVALAQAVDIATGPQPEPVEFLGWVDL